MRKIFVFCKPVEFARDLAGLIKNRQGSKGIECLVDFPREESLNSIPPGYDFYLLHKVDVRKLGKTSYCAISGLRAQNPKSKIIVFSGNTYLPEDIKKCVDTIIDSLQVIGSLDSLFE